MPRAALRHPPPGLLLRPNNKSLLCPARLVAAGAQRRRERQGDAVLVPLHPALHRVPDRASVVLHREAFPLGITATNLHTRDTLGKPAEKKRWST